MPSSRPHRSDPPPIVALREACERLVYASLRLTRLEANEEGLSIPQVFILQALSSVGPIPITQLVLWSGNSPATIGGILDVMEQDGLARRAHGVEDRRQVLASLTPKGRRLAAKLVRKRDARWAALRSALLVRDAAASARALQRVAAGFNAWRRATDHPRRHGAGAGGRSRTRRRGSR